MSASRQFYESFGLQFREEQHGSGPAHLACDMGDAVFEIYPAESGEDLTSRTRVGFRVSNLAAAVQEASKNGGEVISSPRATPWGMRSVLRDPTGHAVELIEPFHV